MTKDAPQRVESPIAQRTRIFKAGNSLAVRIPRGIVKHMDIDDGSVMEIATDGDAISIRKAASEALSDLLDRITPENVHPLIFIESVGAERW